MCLMLWSNTADVFANSIVTTLGFALGGATLCSLQSMHGGEVASESVSSDRLTEGSQSQGLNSRNKLWLLQE